MINTLKSFMREESYDYVVQNYPSLLHLSNASVEELMQIPYIGKVKARELKNIFDLSKQLLIPTDNKKTIKSPNDVRDYLRVMSTYEEEHVIGLYLNTKNRIISQVPIGKGTINSCIVHPREVFAPAIRLKSNSIIVVHNHPSGDPSPSSEDVKITNRLVEAGVIIGISIIDHIIIAGNSFYSFKENNLI